MSNEEQMKFIEMFSGIGGMGWGLMQAGWNCVGYAEIDKYAHQAYEILHDPEKRMWNAYDVKSVTDDDLRLLGRERGPIQLLAGGFPCQSFSIAGKRQGFTDATRGTLFFEIIRWASILRPKHLLLENVTGLLNHDEGRTFQTVIGSLDELGYVGEWCVLNSAAYVPQNRERIFIVASLRGSSRSKVFPFGSENQGLVKSVGNTNPSGNGMNGQVYDAEYAAPTLTTNKGEGNKILIKEISCINPRKDDGSQTYQQDRVYDTNFVMTTLSAELAGRFNILEPVAVLTPDREEKRQNGRRFKEPGEPMFTLTAQDKHGVAILHQLQNEIQSIVKKTRPSEEIGISFQNNGDIRPHRMDPRKSGISELSINHENNESNTITASHAPKIYGETTGYRIRKLTPLECFRLQSYPDEWYYKLKTAGISDSQLYKMAGNGVTSVVAFEIGSRLAAGHRNDRIT